MSSSRTTTTSKKKKTSSGQVLDAVLADLLHHKGFTDVADKLDPSRKAKVFDENNNAISDEEPPPPKDAPTSIRDASVEDILQSYKELYEWVRQSLDMYKSDLFQVLFPVFSHFYIALCKLDCVTEARQLLDTHRDVFDSKFAEDLNSLAMINSKEQVMDDEKLPVSIQYFSKVNIRMSTFAFNILVSFLQDNNLWLVLAAVNQKININVTDSSIDDNIYSKYGARGGNQQQVPIFNQSQVKWGVRQKRKRPLEKNYIQDLERVKSQLQKVRESKKKLGKREKTKLENKVKDFEIRNAKYEDEVVWIGALSSVDKNMPDYMEKKKDKKNKKSGDWKSDIIEKLYTRDAAITKRAMEEDVKKICHLGYMLDRKNKPRGGTKHYSFTGKDDPTLPSIACFTMLNSGDSLTSMDVSSDGAVIAGGYSDNVARLWRLDGEKNIGKEYGVWNNQNSINYNRSNVAISKGQPDEAYARLVGHTMAVTACSIAPDNKWLLTSSLDSKIKLWDVKTQTTAVTFMLGTENFCPAWDVDFGPYGYFFVSGSHDNLGYMWTMERTVPVRHFHGHRSDVETVKFHPNSLLVGTGSSDSTVRLWDCRDAKQVRLFEGHDGPINALAFSPNGEFIASAGNDNTINIWSIKKGVKFSTLEWTQPSDSINKNVWSLDYSVDGTILSSASGDGRLRLWDAAIVQKQTTRKAADFEPHLKTYQTRNTNVLKCRFTQRNVLMVSGEKLSNGQR